MKLTVIHHSGSRFDVRSGTHTVVTDQPVADGGVDAGMSPVELFIGSLASCVGYFVGGFCVRHGLRREGLTVEADWTMAERPHRVGDVHLSIHLPDRVRPEQEERLLKVARACTVHQSMGMKVAIDLHQQSEAAVEERG